MFKTSSPAVVLVILYINVKNISVLNALYMAPLALLERLVCSLRQYKDISVYCEWYEIY